MRRFGRWIINGLTVLSLVLCVAMLALWPRSYFAIDALGRALPWDVYFIGDDFGYIALSQMRIDALALPNSPPQKAKWSYEREALSPPNWGPYNRRFGVYYRSAVTSGIGWEWSVAIPIWQLVAACALIPMARFISWRRTRWAKRNPSACGKCGYNLTGNVSGVCPECGKPIENVAQAK